MLRAALIFPFLITVAGCGQECFVLPSVVLLDTVQHQGTTYYLYSRTTGFQEKQTFFELFNDKPELDDCHVANIKYIAVVPHDHEKFVSELVLQPESTNLLQVSFTSNKNQGYASTDDVRLSVSESTD